MSPDGVHGMVLKICASSLSNPLAVILKLSIETGVVPDQSRSSNVSPLFKKGRRLVAENYRSKKTLDLFVRYVIVWHLDNTNLISDKQHGFVSGRSCVTNLLETIDYITYNAWKKKATDVVFMDFLKAFDMISHRKLIQRLKTYGAYGKLLKWIENFLKNRKQRVMMGDFVSFWIDVLTSIAASKYCR
jgi:hypothetical protein